MGLNYFENYHLVEYDQTHICIYYYFNCTLIFFWSDWFCFSLFYQNGPISLCLGRDVSYRNRINQLGPQSKYL